MKKVVCIVVLLLTMSLGYSQMSGFIVKGNVADSANNKPVEFAAVTITLQTDSNIISGGITDTEGNFTFSVSESGNYRLNYRFIGFNEIKKNIVIKPGVPFFNAGKVLMQQNVSALDGVTVTAEKSYFQNSIDKKVYNIEKDIVASAGSASDALQTIPSVVIDIDGNISLRGNEGVVIFIDGKPSGIVGSNMNAILEQIPASSIESIEVVTNPSARYEAEGNSGIINIVLKKNKKAGLNGNVTTGISTTPKFEGGAALNYRDKKINFYSNYSYVNDNRDGYGASMRKTFDVDTTFYLNSESNSTQKNQMHMARAGIDFYVNEKNTIGFSGTLHSNNSSRDENVNYDFLNYDSILTSLSERTTQGENSGFYYSGGMTYRKTFENLKHVWTAEAYYSKGTGDDFNQYDENFYNTDNTAIGFPLLQNVSSPTINTDISFASDYVHPFKNGNQFEGGLKYTLESKDNTFYSESFDEIINDWGVDDSLNNQFIYNQDVVAAYAIWNSSIKKFGYQIGLRAEQTYTNSELVTTGDVFNKEYLGFFPSAHVAYKFNDATELTASYSRRIDRPNSWFLNPFPDYSDPYSLRVGNPFLEPEYENSYEIAFNKDFKKHSISASLYYNKTLNEISPYFIVNNEGISVMTFQNYNDESKYGVELVGKDEFYKWWNLTTSFNFNQTLLNAENLEAGLNNSQFTYNLRVMSFFQILKQTAFQVTFSYNTPWTFAQGQSQPIYYMDAGLKSDFFKNKLSVNLSMSDVFNTRIWQGYSEGINFRSDYSRKRQSQVGSLKLTYKFGTQDSKRRAGRMDENYDSGGGEMF